MRISDCISRVCSSVLYAMSVGVGAERRPVRHAGWLSLPRNALDQDDVTTAALENITIASAGIMEPLEDATKRFTQMLDRKSVVWGKRGSVLVDLVGRRFIKKKKIYQIQTTQKK